ncbi:MAG TPA: bifunctional YncE family protein/alkaline phosphatase family protein [Vicinamibacterales bacterium]|nr:bifunctional YncE family protein/alkaline phosphatase family protein [Vicinamibacterales bacterium]
MTHLVSPTTMRRVTVGLTAFVLAAAGTRLVMRAQTGTGQATVLPGASPDGSVTLPNGWRLAPAGRTLPLSDLPINVVLSPDGRFAVVLNNGLARPSLSVVDIANWTVASTFALDASWYGLAFSPDGTKVYVGGAAQNNVQEFAFASDGTLTRARTFALPAASGDAFVGGLAVSRDGRTLYATRVFAATLSSIDLASGQVTKTVSLPAEAYTAVVSADGRRVFVSIWGGTAVEVYSSDTLSLVGELEVDEHPNAMVVSNDGRRLFVACANHESVWSFDTASLQPIEQIAVGLYPQAPPTSTPNALGLSPDGTTLLVANADLNAVAIVDVSNSTHAFVNGFVPTGWYPTGAVFTRDGRQMLVLNGKGLGSAANMTNGGMDARLVGSVSAIPTPDRVTLADDTRRVSSLTAYSDTIRLTPSNAPIGSAIPAKVGAASPIKHVFYIIRENRTYDQVLGDLAQGNGEPKMTLFGSDVTPNGHALAQAFVLFDNFYVDADVSYNGHAFSTAAYATDFVQKMWQTYMAGRGGPYLTEGGGVMRNPFGNISAPEGGYIWDAAKRAGVSVRDYGEFVAHTTRSAAGDVTAVATVPGLSDAVAPAYAGWDLDITDQKRADRWLDEFRAYEANGALPQLSVIRLPNDHTAGTKAGVPTPRAMVADNDLALGRIVEAISTSPVYWKDSAVFVLEDDAQAGPDHVDSHRSVLLVASPFAKRGFVDHTLYTTSGVLRTIELMLGLAPMSQYDAAAAPLYNAFTGTPNLAAFAHVAARVPLDEKNLPSAFGAVLSAKMDFSAEDRAPEQLLNEILWRSIKGVRTPMPPPRRSVLVRPTSSSVDGDDDDDHN